MERTSRLVGHIFPSKTNSKHIESMPCSGFSKSADDVVIVAAVRTAIGRARKGSFKDTHPVDLLTACLEGVIEKSGVSKEVVEDIVVGNVLAAGGFANQARQASFIAGFPVTTSVTTTNRQCSSGLQATSIVASAISSGFYDIGIAAGVESMTQTPMGANSVGPLNPKIKDYQLARDCLTPMGITSENVAAKYGITRKQQDFLASESHRRALKAIDEGLFKSEIVPVTTKIKGKDGKWKEITVTQDDGPRKGSTVERLAKLRAVFKKGGSTTAGNSSQVSDGAAAVLLMKRSKAKELNAPIMGVFRGFTVAGVEPTIMGIGPAVAIPKVLEKTGLNVNDIDIYEINEAFASQATYCVDVLGIPLEKVNVNGGAIALGHPLGCTGARQIATILPALANAGKKLGVVSMCIGTGMGAAAVIERE